jgi:hypothetical protein
MNDQQRDDAVADISDADQLFLRALFVADVADPPPSAVTVESILAAARGDSGIRHAVGGRTDPVTDRLPVIDRASAAPSSGTSAPDFDDRMLGGRERPMATPAWPGDELAARRRRRRGGLLAVAAVAAVLAVGVPIALQSANPGSGTSANQAGQMAATSGASAYGPAAPAPGAGSAESGRSETAADGSGADRSGPASGSAAMSASDSAGSSPDTGSAATSSARASASPVASAPARSEATVSAASSGSAASLQSGSASGSESTPAAGSAGAGQAPAASSSGGSADSRASTTNCRWPELPAAVDQLAKKTLGSVVGARRSLTSACSGARVAGAELPAADRGGGGVTVQVVRAATGACATHGCRRIGDGVYAGQNGGTHIVWTYQGGREVTVEATQGIVLTQAQLVTFARGVGDLVR